MANWMGQPSKLASRKAGLPKTRGVGNGADREKREEGIRGGGRRKRRGKIGDVAEEKIYAKKKIGCSVPVTSQGGGGGKERPGPVI